MHKPGMQGLRGMQEPLLAAIALCAADEDELKAMGASSLLESTAKGTDEAAAVETGVKPALNHSPCPFCCPAMAACP